MKGLGFGFRVISVIIYTETQAVAVGRGAKSEEGKEAHDHACRRK